MNKQVAHWAMHLLCRTWNTCLAGNYGPENSGKNQKGPIIDILSPEFAISKTILSGIDDIKPEIVTFWGVGLTDSDTDLMALYRKACKNAKAVELINPSCKVIDRARKLLGCEVCQYMTVEEWLEKGA
jgi:hypothetical protein